MCASCFPFSSFCPLPSRPTGIHIHTLTYRYIHTHIYIKAKKAGEKVVTDEDIAFKAKQKADAAAMKKAADALKAKKK